MTKQANNLPHRGEEEVNSSRSLPPTLRALSVILFAEAAAMIVILVFFVGGVVTGTAENPGTAVAITVVIAVAAVFLVTLAIASLSAKPWMRSAALMWQILQLAVAVGAFQGVFASPGIAWLILVPTVAAIILLFTPSVVHATRRI